MHKLAIDSGKGERVGLANAGEGTREVSVVLHRNNTVQSLRCQWHIALCLRQALFIRAASRGFGIQHTLDAQGACYQHADLTRVNIAGRANACPIECLDILNARWRSRAVLLSIAESERCLVGVSCFGDENVR